MNQYVVSIWIRFGSTAMSYYGLVGQDLGGHGFLFLAADAEEARSLALRQIAAFPEMHPLCDEMMLAPMRVVSM